MPTPRHALKSALEILFLLFIFSLGFMQPNIAIRGLLVTVTDLIFLATSAIWFLALVSRRSEFRFDKVYLLFGIYALTLLLSSVFSENQRLSFFKYLGESYLVALAVMAFNLVTTHNIFKKVILVWLAASGISALVGAAAVVMFYLGLSNSLTDFAIHGYGSLPPGNYPRIQSTFIYPSMLCNYLTVSVMMMFAARKLGWINNAHFILLSILFAVTIAFTLTPGIGGVLLAIALWIGFAGKDGRSTTVSKLAFAGGILAALCFLLVSAFTLIKTPTSPFYLSLGGLRVDPTQRLLTWQAAFQTFLDHPLFGKGLGLGVAQVYFMPPSGQMQLLTDAHNVFLSVAAQAGIFAVIALTAICVFMIRVSRPFQTDSGDLSVLRRCLGLAFVSAFLYQGLVGSFEDARHLWVLTGLILAVSRIEKQPDKA